MRVVEYSGLSRVLIVAWKFKVEVVVMRLVGFVGFVGVGGLVVRALVYLGLETISILRMFLGVYV